MNRLNNQGVSRYNQAMPPNEEYFRISDNQRRLMCLNECARSLVIVENISGYDVEKYQQLEAAGVIDRITRPAGAILGKEGPVDIYRPSARGDAILDASSELLDKSMLELWAAQKPAAA